MKVLFAESLSWKANIPILDVSAGSNVPMSEDELPEGCNLLCFPLRIPTLRSLLTGEYIWNATTVTQKRGDPEEHNSPWERRLLERVVFELCGRIHRS